MASVLTLSAVDHGFKYRYSDNIKPAHAVTCIKRSPFSCPVVENCM